MNYFKHETALIHPKAQIGRGSQIWAFTNIQEGSVIGEDCKIADGCFIEKGAILGNRVTLKNGVAIFDGVILEDDVFCGVNVGFINDRNPRSCKKDWVLEKVLVKKGATLGSNATILCGVTIGEYALVGAGSTVTKDVPAYTLVVGTPAQPKGYVCQCGQKLAEPWQCPCGLHYENLSHKLFLRSEQEQA